MNSILAHGSSRFAALVLGVVVSAVAGCRETSPAYGSGPPPAAIASTRSDSDEEARALSERLRRALLVRTAADGDEYGVRDLDPLLWPSSWHLLTSPRYDEIESMLTELDAQRLIPRDPLRRAMLERDLWAIFDWLVHTGWLEGQVPNRSDPTPQLRIPRARHLSRLVGRALQRVALTTHEIEALPDNLRAAIASRAWPPSVVDEASDEPFLPADLLDPTGAWVELRSTDYERLTPLHDEAFGFRSVFTVLMRLPGGRAATLDYIRRLREFPDPLIRDARPGQERPPDPDSETRAGWLFLNRGTPQFPVGTALALVRRMVLFDDEGRLHLSEVVESVQIRRFRKIDPAVALNTPFIAPPGDQHVVEFVLDRELFCAGEQGGLHAVARDEVRHSTFLTHDFDLFWGSEDKWPARPVLDACIQCHGAPGIFSMVSYTRLHTGAGTQFFMKTLKFPRQFVALDAPFVARNWRAFEKLRQFDWGVLQELFASTR